MGPGTRTSSTAVFRRETKTFSKPVTVRGRVSSYSESHQGKCLSKNFVTSLYFSTAMKLFPMKSFCYFTISFISNNPDFPHENYQRFDLDSMNSAECKAEFRVEKHDLPRLVTALQLPPVFKCEQRSICDDVEGLCILLKRVTYPCRLSDLIPRFGRPVCFKPDLK